MKSDYETSDELCVAVRALAMVPRDDVADAFDLHGNNMPEHEKMPELLRTLCGRRRTGRGRYYGPAIFLIETYNHHQTAAESNAGTTNAAEGWHFDFYSNCFSVTIRHCRVF